MSGVKITFHENKEQRNKAKHERVLWSSCLEKNKGTGNRRRSFRKSCSHHHLLSLQETQVQEKESCCARTNDLVQGLAVDMKHGKTSAPFSMVLSSGPIKSS
jgi:hypothetical protein